MAGGVRVRKLFKLDLIDSINTISRLALLRKLDPDRYVFNLILSYLECPILGEDGKNRNRLANIGVLPAGLLASILLHFMLADFDREFITAYSGLSYSRFIHEGFVSFPLTSLKIENEYFKDDILNFLLQLDMSGEILSIVPGGTPMPCYGSLIFISRDGLIQFVEMQEWSEVSRSLFYHQSQCALKSIPFPSKTEYAFEELLLDRGRESAVYKNRLLE